MLIKRCTFIISKPCMACCMVLFTVFSAIHYVACYINTILKNQFPVTNYNPCLVPACGQVVDANKDRILMKQKSNNIGPTMTPCGTPERIVSKSI